MGLLAHPVVPLGFAQPLFVCRRELRPVDLDRQLVELAGEPERHLVVVVVGRRAGVGADVEAFVPLEDDRDGALHLLSGHVLPSTLSTPVPPRPRPLVLLKASVAKPRPSYLKSNSSACLPDESASVPSQR